MCAHYMFCSITEQNSHKFVRRGKPGKSGTNVQATSLKRFMDKVDAP